MALPIWTATSLVVTRAEHVRAAVGAEVDEREQSVDSTRLRRPLRKLIERSLPALSYREISNEVEVEAVGMVEDRDAS